MNIQENSKSSAPVNCSPMDFPALASDCDAVLVAEAKSGSSVALGELYERHHRRVYRTVFRVLRNEQDAEDAVQRAFQRALINLSRFREDSTFSTWVTRIAINEALMLLRQRRGNTLLPGNDNGDTEDVSEIALADRGPSPEEALAENELRAVVMHAISRLRKNLRVVIFLREFQGLTSAETARRLGLTVSAVKARTFHARRYLRRYIERKHKPALNSFLCWDTK
jgi:RNA polymerase sigma-70 factor (ECF subfamily)